MSWVAEQRDARKEARTSYELNGHDRVRAGLALLRTAVGPGLFEWPGISVRAAAVWIFLGAALAIPFPAYGWMLPERAVPIMWLMVAGAGVLAAYVARASWPLALLILWAIARTAYHAFPQRSLQVLALFALTALLYAAARDLPERWARWTAGAFVVGLGFEALLGALNAAGIYPGMAWVDSQQIGKPMGLLTHPNYWGSYMALGLPLIWALLGLPAALAAFLLILRTVSGGPVITAGVAALVIVWPLFGRVARWATVVLGGAAVAVTMTLHEWRLSGRREVWQTAFGEIMRWPVMGQGLGQWRQWAEDYNAGHKSVFATLQAHNEPYQLWFELGLIGVVLGALWALQAALAARAVWQAAPATRLPSPWYAWGRIPLERAWIAVLAAAAVNMLGSPTFHLPAQGALTLFALARVQADSHALHAGSARAAVPAAAPETRRPRRSYATTSDRS